MAVNDTLPRVDSRRPPAAAFLYDPKVRGILFQAALTIGLIVIIGWAFLNAYQNLQRANIASGFGFLSARAGFDISQTLIAYSSESTYGRAFLVGLVNTLLVASLGIVLASILGFLIGIARLSGNWLIARLATVYVETLRNIPLLLQLLFWYKAVLAVLPGPRQAYDLPFDSHLSNRGLIMPYPVFEPGFGRVLVALVVAVLAVLLLRQWAKRRQMATGKPFPTVLVSLAVLIGLPLIVFQLSGAPLSLDYPELAGFNFAGGTTIRPEFMALLAGLVLYTAAYIAEVVRAGILAVARGQTEAAYALGLRANTTMRLVIVPQALRVIIPPLTNQYLNLTKNSSLAVAVGYPDLVAVFSGTVLNQTGQAVEVISITMAVYLMLSLATSAFMNWFNQRVALVER